MIRLGEYLCGLLIVFLMLPVLLLGFMVTSVDLAHYVRNRSK